MSAGCPNLLSCFVSNCIYKVAQSYLPEGFQTFNREMPLCASWLGHSVLVSKEAPFLDRLLKIDCLDPLNTHEMFSAFFIEGVWRLNIEFGDGGWGEPLKSILNWS